MGRSTHDVEYEQMLLSRHELLRHRSGALDRSAYILLSRIRVQGPMSIGELSEAFALDTSTLNRQTAAAMRAGLVERIPDPEGGMARKFRITTQGARMLDEERRPSSAAWTRSWPTGPRRTSPPSPAISGASTPTSNGSPGGPGPVHEPSRPIHSCLS